MVSGFLKTAAVTRALWSLKIHSPRRRWRLTAAVTLFLLVLFRKPGNIKCRFKQGHKKKNIHGVTQAVREKKTVGNLFHVRCPHVPLCSFNGIKPLKLVGAEKVIPEDPGYTC